MGTFMLTPMGTDGPATTGYQLLGQAADFNQYMNKRVRVVGSPRAEDRERSDSDVPGKPTDAPANEAPWPKLQVREVDPVGGQCDARF